MQHERQVQKIKVKPQQQTFIPQPLMPSDVYNQMQKFEPIKPS